MKIDSHQHFWKYNSGRDSWISEAMAVLKRDFLPGDFALERAANGIDASIAVQTSESEEETRFLLDLAEGDEKIVGVVGWVDLCSPRVAETLDYFSQFKKVCGFRHIAQSEPDDRFLLRRDFTNGISHLREFGFAYDILVYPKQLPAAIELVAKFPEQRFVIDHLAKPQIMQGNIASWAANILEIAKAPNVYCKVSGMVTEADWRYWKPSDFKPYLDVVFEAFGSERLMFGSDWPVCLLAASYRQVKKLLEDYLQDSPVNEKTDIFGGNTLRFYALKAVPHGLTP